MEDTERRFVDNLIIKDYLFLPFVNTVYANVTTHPKNHLAYYSHI